MLVIIKLNPSTPKITQTTKQPPGHKTYCLKSIWLYMLDLIISKLFFVSLNYIVFKASMAPMAALNIFSRLKIAFYQYHPT